VGQTSLFNMVSLIVWTLVAASQSLAWQPPLELVSSLTRWQNEAKGRSVECQWRSKDLEVENSSSNVESLDSQPIVSKGRIQFFSSDRWFWTQEYEQDGVEYSDRTVVLSNRLTTLQVKSGMCSSFFDRPYEPIGYVSETYFFGGIGGGIVSLESHVKELRDWKTQQQSGNRIFSAANSAKSFKISVDSLGRVNHVSCILHTKHLVNGSPVTTKYELGYRYAEASDQVFHAWLPVFLRVDCEVKANASHTRGLVEGTIVRMEEAEPMTSLKDFVVDITNGTRVDVGDYPGIEFEWLDGEIVRKIDRKKVASLTGFKFSSAKWVIPSVLLVAIAAGCLWWKHRTN
jgi:hypothetical protein